MTFYKTAKFAALSGISRRTLKRWLKSGKLTPILINNKGENFYSDEQIEEVKKILNKKISTLTDEKNVGWDIAGSDKFTPKKLPSVQNLTKNLKNESKVVTTSISWLTTATFSERSGISVETLKTWRKSGKLTPNFTDLKGHHLYSEEQIEEAKKIFGKKFPTSENKKSSDSESPKKVAPKKDEPLPVINHPAKNFIIPIDKLSKNIFDTTNHSQKRGIIECKKPLITTKFDLEFLKGYNGPRKLDRKKAENKLGGR